MTLLQIDTSILGGNSVSRDLTALIVERLAGPDTQVVYRDLVAEPLPHVTPVAIPTAHPLSAAAGPLDGEAGGIRQQSDAVLQEFLDADTIVIGVPMYNFTIPSQLKAWIDRIIVPGTTFRYGENGPEGLATGKRVIAAIARGGFYGKETGMESAEHAETYLGLVFGFVGVTDLEFVVAEGLSQGEATRATALESARAAVGQLIG